ncbi:MAG: hypothetical protein ACJAR0_003836 [Candidatus Azotimanducaceae bacterium]
MGHSLYLVASARVCQVSFYPTEKELILLRNYRQLACSAIVAISIMGWAVPLAAESALNIAQLTLHKVTATVGTHQGRAGIRIVEPGSPTLNEDKLAILPTAGFVDGTIEGWVNGSKRSDAAAGARGFIGLAFRINEDVSAFEAVYLRPTNGRADNQLRRNHTVQYFVFPEYPWHRLRAESPGKYETYADIAPDTWIHFRLELDGDTARLFLDKSEHPSFVVTDLLAEPKAGRVGFWIGPGTEAWFSDIKVMPNH